MSDLDIDVDKLICLVHERPVLWDKTMEIYKDRNLTREAWRQVCVEFVGDFDSKTPSEKKSIGKLISPLSNNVISLSGQQIMKKWNNIRDSWMKTNRKLKEGQKSGSGANKIRKYIYHDELMFLKKICEHRPSDSSFEAEERNISQKNTDNLPDNSTSETFTEEQGYEEADAAVEQQIRPTEKTTTQKRSDSGTSVNVDTSTAQGNKGFRDGTEPGLATGMPVCNRGWLPVCNRGWLPACRPDEDEVFFISITPAVQKMSANDKLEFRMGVLGLIRDINRKSTNFEFNSLAHSFSSTSSSPSASTSSSHTQGAILYNSLHSVPSNESHFPAYSSQLQNYPNANSQQDFSANHAT
ncbi:uncharacterized protein LOC134531343 [Bacillus rossius redtenbacheri]|uniref:uncharacterized protein LOC134531343 n=1 Tax=Bacillus rossius redtenbacheri TaxID=93214 RepID=UPI002FDE200E